ncbi:hypothetical protein [Sphingobacterium lumbrici]|uniref:hypothetical protein n=1 Tax=Sphingobacterium lumbrici TaxID=2559600 RepID=UPI00112C1CC1|nr:hypothetical protein [Sphingobacterium lumbrici]
MAFKRPLRGLSCQKYANLPAARQERVSVPICITTTILTNSTNVALAICQLHEDALAIVANGYSDEFCLLLRSKVGCPSPA